jgi:1,4-dihydroxy-2-naphthoate octaprenyltransferase
MGGPGDIFVFIFVGGIIIVGIQVFLGKSSKPAKIKEKYPNEIEKERHALRDDPEKFNSWLKSRQDSADRDKDEKHNAISLVIGIPVALIIGAIILAWIYSA